MLGLVAVGAVASVESCDHVSGCSGFFLTVAPLSGTRRHGLLEGPGSCWRGVGFAGSAGRLLRWFLKDRARSALGQGRGAVAAPGWVVSAGGDARGCWALAASAAARFGRACAGCPAQLVPDVLLRDVFAVVGPGSASRLPSAAWALASGCVGG